MARSELIDELNRLKKSDLIDVIIYGKVTSEVKISDNLKGFLEESGKASVNQSNNTKCESEVTVPYDHGINWELKTTQLELEYCKKLNFQLEKQLKTFEIVLDIIKDKKETAIKSNLSEIATSSHMTEKKLNAQLERKTDETYASTSNKKSEQKTLVLETERQREIMNNVIFQEKESKSKMRNSKVIGTDETINNIAANKTDWIFVSKFKTTFTLDDLQNFLKKKFPQKIFICYQQESKWNTFNSFRIAADSETKQLLLDAKIWPKGIEVSDYLFRKSKGNRAGTKWNHKSYSGRAR